MVNLSPSQGPRWQLASGFLENGTGDDYGRSVDSRQVDYWSPAMREEESLPREKRRQAKSPTGHERAGTASE
jgi:hypothetical protein